MDIAQAFRRAVEEFDRRVQAVGGDQWDNPTPCTEWSVRHLVNHIVYEDRWAVPILAGKTIEEVGDRFEGDLVGEAPQDAWADASREALQAVRAVDLDRMVHVSWGQIRARDYLEQLFQDHLIHGWDLARGTDGEDTLDPELVEFCWIRAKAQEDAIRASTVFGDQQEVPEGADTQTRLLALLGRRA